MIEAINRRYLTQEFRLSNDNSSPKITGYAALFNSASEDLGGWSEVIDPGAFDNVMRTNPDVRGLFNHDANCVLSRTASGTMTLTIDEKGLRYDINPPDTQLARDLITSMKRGDINQSSFAFRCSQDSWKDNVRHIMEVSELFDVSVVTYPAYASASADARTLPESMPVELRSRIEARAKKTKRVDGEDLASDAFLIVLDPEKTDTWHLPWKFSTDEKTKAHLRDALARFDQLKDISEDVLKAAWKKLLSLCKQHDIEVSERALTDECICTCPQCMQGACGICSADPQCLGAERNWRLNAELRLRLAEVL